ncbi:MAG: hypothetical protein ACE5GL_12255 [Calditrichia bacterium]
MISQPEPSKSPFFLLFKWWNRHFPTFGLLSIASFATAVLSGIVLGIIYNIHEPVDSLQIIQLSIRGGRLFRGVHYWSGQFFLIFTLIHTVEHFLFKTERKVKSGVWLRLTISIPFIFFVMLSGFILKGDSEGLLARRILSGLLEVIPATGNFFKFIVLGKEPDFQIIYLHHIATVTIIIALVIIEHARRIWPDRLSVIYILSGSLLLGIWALPSLHDGINPVIKGPWYFLGLQEILHWTTHPIWIPIAALIFLIAIYLIPKIQPRSAVRVKQMLLVLLNFYILLSL